MKHLRSLFVLDSASLPLIYGAEELRAVADRVKPVAPPQTRESIVHRRDLLAEVDVLFSGWGAPRVDEAFLASAPRLKAIFYGAGSIGGWVTQAVWDRGIVVTSAAAANAVPVAEYTLATILFSLKHGWALARQTRDQRKFVERNGAPGCYGTTVGLISLGVTARTVLRLLKPFDLKVVVYDPFVTHDEAAELGVELVPLDELFRRCDVVSLHAPLLTETVGIIKGSHIASMKPGATFINTARGPIVREPEMLDVLARRPDLQAVLDVVAQEPPAHDSPLYTLPNVVLTPHIAGSVGNECLRMGRYMVEELDRYLSGQPLKWAITPEIAAISSHRQCTPTDVVAAPALPTPVLSTLLQDVRRSGARSAVAT